MKTAPITAIKIRHGVTSLWTARILPRVDVAAVAHLDYNRDLWLDGRWIGCSGTDHGTILLATNHDRGPARYVADAE